VSIRDPQLITLVRSQFRILRGKPEENIMGINKKEKKDSRVKENEVS